VEGRNREHRLPISDALLWGQKQKRPYRVNVTKLRDRMGTSFRPRRERGGKYWTTAKARIQGLMPLARMKRIITNEGSKSRDKRVGIFGKITNVGQRQGRVTKPRNPSLEQPLKRGGQTHTRGYRTSQQKEKHKHQKKRKKKSPQRSPRNEESKGGTPFERALPAAKNARSGQRAGKRCPEMDATLTGSSIRKGKERRSPTWDCDT